MGAERNDRVGMGFSFQDIEGDIHQLTQHAKSRLPIIIGDSSSLDLLNRRLSIKNVETLDPLKATRSDIFYNALALRNIVEWNGWGPDTAFPYVKEQAEAGEPLGQCLVTARFAKDYFEGAKLTEVRVKHYNGEVVGPHVILTLPTQQGNDLALDLTPDQALAAGEIPPSAKALNPFFKVNLVPFNDPRCPYIFVRNQDDAELATKRSHPLEHTNCLKEKVAFALGLSQAPGIEKYAHKIGAEEFPEAIDPFLHQQLLKYNPFGKSVKMPRFYIQSAVISPTNYRPDPKWLWDTAGLAGSDKAVIYNNGYVQEFLNFDGTSIYVNNLCGFNPPDELLDYGATIVENDKSRVIAGKPLIITHVDAKKWTGPVFVQAR